MEFKEKQETILTQTCDGCGHPAAACTCVKQHPPRTIGNYELGDCLSNTPRSQLLKARNKSTGQNLVVKLIRSLPVDDRTAQRRLQQEGNAVIALNHPHLAAVYEFGLSEENVPFTARDYVEGESLTKVVDKAGSLPHERFYDIFIQVANGLAYAHESKVIHRSLKPDNIIISREPGNKGDFVKLLDFAVSSMVPPRTREDLQQSRSGDICYLSPEQCLGDPVTSASDVYALGCIMYEALCGHPPFEEGANKDEVEVMCKQISVTPLAVSSACRQGVPHDLELLVMSCLAKNPAERPSIEEVEQALQKLQTETDSLKPKPSSQPQPNRHSRTRQTLPDKPRPSPRAGLISVIVLGVIAFGVYLVIANLSPDLSQAKKAVWQTATDNALKLEKLGDYAEMEASLKEAASLAEKGGADEKDLAVIRSKLGSLYYSQDRPREALPLLLQALPLYERIEGPESVNVAWIATDITEIAQTTDNWELAIEMYKKLEPIRLKEDGPNSAKYANLLGGMGGAYLHTHNYTEAEKHLRMCLEIRRKLKDVNNVAQSKTQLNLAYTLDTLAKPKEAEELYKQAIASAQKTVPVEKKILARSLEYYGNFLKRQGKRAQGEKFSQQSRLLEGKPVQLESSTGSSASQGKYIPPTSRTKKVFEGSKKLFNRFKELKDQF